MTSIFAFISASCGESADFRGSAIMCFAEEYSKKPLRLAGQPRAEVFYFRSCRTLSQKIRWGMGRGLKKKVSGKKKVSKSKSGFFDILPNFLLFSSRLLHHTHRHPQIVHLVQSLPVPMQNGAGDRLLRTYKKSVPGTVPALARKIQNRISE